MISGINTIALTITMLFAIVQCLFGYKLLKFWIAFVGFLLGAFIGGTLVAVAVSDMNWLTYLGAIAGGVLFACIAFKIYLVGIFILCGFLAFVAVNTISVSNSRDTLIHILSIVAFFVVGYLTVKFARPAIIFSTAISGAITLANSIVLIIPLFDNQILVLILIIAISASGILFQWNTTTEEKET